MQQQLDWPPTVFDSLEKPYTCMYVGWLPRILLLALTGALVTRPGEIISRDLEREIRIRDGNRCCLSKRRSNFFDALIVSPIIPSSVFRIWKDVILLARSLILSTESC